MVFIQASPDPEKGLQGAEYEREWTDEMKCGCTLQITSPVRSGKSFLGRPTVVAQAV